eukprot:3378653-Pyramimonas_sp.AAC.1
MAQGRRPFPPPPPPPSDGRRLSDPTEVGGRHPPAGAAPPIGPRRPPLVGPDPIFSPLPIGPRDGCPRMIGPRGHRLPPLPCP